MSKSNTFEKWRGNNINQPNKCNPFFNRYTKINGEWMTYDQYWSKGGYLDRVLANNPPEIVKQRILKKYGNIL